MEDRIRQLCKALLCEEDPEQCRPLIAQLRYELYAHVEGLRRRPAGYPVVRERRAVEVQASDDLSFIPRIPRC